MADDMNIGLETKARGQVADGLSKLQADTYAVYLKTHGYHWNVRGPYFAQLHALLEQQYNEVWTAVDRIAERVRALGGLAPMGYARFAELSPIRDGDPEQSSDAMLADLVKDHETLVATARAARATADQAGDDTTASLIDDRIEAHEKHAWMLRASLR
jgi:starvation-inducible DNA-binding protein